MGWRLLLQFKLPTPQKAYSSEIPKLFNTPDVVFSIKCMHIYVANIRN